MKYKVEFELYASHSAVSKVTFEVEAKDKFDARSVATDGMRVLNIPVKDIFISWEEVE
jgi:hypothetical protein